MPDLTATTLRDFRAVYRDNHGFVWHALHRFGIAAGAIEDAVQDVFVVAYRRRTDRYGASTRAWLYGIARRVASNYRRSDRRRTLREDAVRNAPHSRSQAGAHEAIQTFDRYLSSLSAADRELFVLAELEGMTGPEIATALGRNVQTIYSRVRKLRADLHQHLGHLERVRAARPAGTERSFAALVPLLPLKAKAATTLGASLVAGILGAAAATTLLVAADRVLPPSAEPPTEQVRHAAAPALPQTRAHAPVAAVTIAAAPQAAPGLPPQPLLTPAARAKRRRKKPSGDGTTVEPASSAVDHGLAAQNRMLTQASRALEAGRASDALALTTTHHQRFPDSPLSDLRTALQVEALCDLGRTADAKSLARAFVRTHPSSPVRRRIGSTCAGPSQESAKADTEGV